MSLPAAASSRYSCLHLSAPCQKPEALQPRLFKPAANGPIYLDITYMKVLVFSKNYDLQFEMEGLDC
jgi:hypothetical protein